MATGKDEAMTGDIAPKTLAPVIPAGRALAATAVACGLDWEKAGVHEIGDTNSGDEVDFYLRVTGLGPGFAWCAAFVSACLCRAYCRLTRIVEIRPNIINSRTEVSKRYILISASCAEIQEAARERYKLRSKTFSPKPGDLVLYNFNGEQTAHHVGLVVAALPAGLIRTVEGNTSPQWKIWGSQRDGGGVHVRVRGRGSVVGFVDMS